MKTIFLYSLPLLVLLWTSQAQRVERIGNDLIATQSGVDQPGATILLNDKALSRGLLFAYSAFFRSLKAAVFQIWRPTIAQNQFKLIAQTRVLPTVKNQREDIYIASLLSAKCLVIKNGDKLGLYTEEAPAPVAYKFTAQNPTSLMNLNPNVSDPYVVGDSVNFDSLAFPYALSVAAYIDTSIENDTLTDDFMDCPKDLLIPEHVAPTLPTTTPTPPPTGRPGDTGARGPVGATGATGPTGRDGMNGTMGATGPTGLMGMNGTDGEVGATGATGMRGMAGATGGRGEMGATGKMGPKGNNGKDGNDGNDGSDGRNGVNGTWIYVKESDAAAVSDENMWLNPVLIMILVIWLIIVTVILLILTCSFCCYACRKKENEEAKSQYSTSNGIKSEAAYVNVGYAGGESESDQKKLNRLSSFEPGQEWIQGMKSDDTINFNQETIERADSTKNKPAPLSTLPPHLYDEDTETRIPKTPDNVLTDDEAAAASSVTVDVPPTPTSPDFPPPPPPMISSAPDGGTDAASPQSPTTPTARWSQSQDQLIAY